MCQFDRLHRSNTVGFIPHRSKQCWVIVTFGEAGDTACFQMYIMSYEYSSSCPIAQGAAPTHMPRASLGRDRGAGDAPASAHDDRPERMLSAVCCALDQGA